MNGPRLHVVVYNEVLKFTWTKLEVLYGAISLVQFFKSVELLVCSN